ncbi:MAG: hypothetical protein ACRC5H_04250 [Treponemataceae bacterium]
MKGEPIIKKNKEFLPIQNDFFTCSRLKDLSGKIVDSFKSDKNEQLELYLQGDAFSDDKTGKNRIYIIQNSKTQELVAYFALKANSMILTRDSERNDVYPAIELSCIAKNTDYIEDLPLGNYIFINFIYPIAKKASTYIGVNYTILFSLPVDKLIETYEKWGFQRLNTEAEEFIHKNTKSYWADNCIFMYLDLNKDEEVF